MKPWVKTPTDLAPLLRASVDARVERTFRWLWDIARREPPELMGYLYNGTHPLTLRELARRIDLPKSTVADHVRRLADVGLVVEDLAGRLFIPLVIDTEIRYARRSRTNDDAGAVENGERRPGAEQLSVRVSGRSPPKPGHPLLSSTSELSEDVTSPSLESPVEDCVPLDSLSDCGDCWYPLQKLAGLSPAWEAFSLSFREVATVRRLQAEHHGALHTALGQALDGPEKQRRPGAWLTITVPKIAQSWEASA